MKLELNFETDNRIEALRSIDLTDASPRQLDMAADYLLASIPKSERDFEFAAMRSYFGSHNAPASLESLVEIGAEGTIIQSAFGANPLKPPSRHACLNRADVSQRLLHADPEVQRRWQELWRNIDEHEYVVQRYELFRGKRRADLPIRQELQQRVEDAAARLDAIAASIEPYEYLKMKRRLVELRKEQYVLLDALKGERVRRHAARSVAPAMSTAVSIYPFESAAACDVISPACVAYGVLEEAFSKANAAKLISALQRLDSASDSEESSGGFFDFRHPEHVRALVSTLRDLDAQAKAPWSLKTESARQLLHWFAFYVRRAGILDDPMLRTVLRGKAEGKRNADIAVDIDAACGKQYKASYISIVYARRVIAAITKAAKEHVRLVEYILMGKQVFKRCTECGELLPRNAEYFYKRQHSADGFSGVCKHCLKEAKRNERTAL